MFSIHILENNFGIQSFDLLITLVILLAIILVLVFLLSFLRFCFSFLIWTYHDTTGWPFRRTGKTQLFFRGDKYIWNSGFFTEDREMGNDVDWVYISGKDQQPTI
jgi:hypothetical protein